MGEKRARRITFGVAAIVCLVGAFWWWRTSQPSGSERAAWRYLDALHDGDAAGAHEQLCPQVRDHVTVDDVQAASDDMERRRFEDEHTPGDEGATAPDGFRYVNFTRTWGKSTGPAHLRAVQVDGEGWRVCPYPVALSGAGMG